LSQSHRRAGIALTLAALSQQAIGEEPVTKPRPVNALLTAALIQVGVTTIYDRTFVKLAYPGGDVPRERDVCTDVTGSTLVRSCDRSGLELSLAARYAAPTVSPMREFGLAGALMSYGISNAEVYHPVALSLRAFSRETLRQICPLFRPEKSNWSCI
jgi:hypothetical protein